MDRLSNEIISEILSSSVQFSSLFNYSLTLGHLSPWARALRHKKALVLVSRRWYNIATPILYRNVVLRRSGQLHQLIHTLIDSFHASHIEEITVAESCHVGAVMAQIFVQNLEILLHLCKKITTFEFHLASHVEIDVNWLLALPRLAHLSLGSTFKSKELETILWELSPTLSSLDVYLAPDDEFETTFDFPLLHTLKVNIRPPPDDLDDKICYFAECWSFPLLRNVTILFASNDDALACSKCLEEALRAFGKSIRYLGICNTFLPYTTIESIFESCPNLEHLAVDILSTKIFVDETSNTHGNLRVLDIFEKYQKWPVVKERLQNSAVPLVRFFPQSKNDNIFHPSAAAHANPIQLFKEGFSWMAPSLDIKIDHLPERLATDPTRTYQGTCVYVVHPPSEYHPSADEWGLPSVLDELEQPMFANDSKKQVTVGEDTAEEADSDLDEVDSDSESSMSETSHESGCTESWRIEEVV